MRLRPPLPVLGLVLLLAGAGRAHAEDRDGGSESGGADGGSSPA
jgi:hypothetical protein